MFGRYQRESRKETLRLFGDFYLTSRVRAAMFNAALSWRPLDLCRAQEVVT